MELMREDTASVAEADEILIEASEIIVAEVESGRIDTESLVESVSHDLKIYKQTARYALLGMDFEENNGRISLL